MTSPPRPSTLILALITLAALAMLATPARAEVPGTPGTAGVPVLTAGVPLLSDTYLVSLANARPDAQATLLWGATPGPTLTGKGTLGLGGNLIVFLFSGATTPAGTLDVPFALPDDPVLIDFPVHIQWAVKDPVNPKGVALSNSHSTALFAADLDVDADRDGTVETASAEDDLDEHLWSAARGAVFLFNADDDDGDGTVDGLDLRFNGAADALDMAPVQLRALPFLPADWTGELGIDATSATRARLWHQVAGVWKRYNAAAAETLSAAQLTGGHAFLIEAAGFAETASGTPGLWSGEVDLVFTLRDGAGAARSSDAACLKVAPFVLHDNLAPVHTVFVTRKANTLPFIAELGAPVAAGGAALHEIDGIGMGPNYDIWAQDAMEFGTASMPGVGGPRHLPVVLRSPRDWPLDPWTTDHWLGPDQGYLMQGSFRPGVDWIDWFGNLDCTPPLPGWPLGRVYTGYQGALTMHPDVLAFLEAQGVQAPVLQIDTGWLLIGHVDEQVCFVPSNVGKPWRVVIPSTAMALGILADLRAAGQGALPVFEGQGDETTVDGLIAWADFVTYNQQCQLAIDGMRAEIEAGFGIEPGDVIELPALFWKGGGTERAIAHMPNMVNALVVGKRFITSDPFGPRPGGIDAFAQPVIDALTPLGMAVDFVDDWYPYHEWWGEVHCGTNATREPSPTPWWSVP